MIYKFQECEDQEDDATIAAYCSDYDHSVIQASLAFVVSCDLKMITVFQWLDEDERCEAEDPSSSADFQVSACLQTLQTNP